MLSFDRVCLHCSVACSVQEYTDFSSSEEKKEPVQWGKYVSERWSFVFY